MLRIGVDLGGTKIEAIVLRLPENHEGAVDHARRTGGDPPDVLVRRRVPTDRDQGYEHVVQTAARLIAQVASEAGLSTLPKIGVGMPGGVTRDEVPLVKNSNTTCLNGRPFRFDLEAAVGARVAFANDANCFALAEAIYGAARGADVTFGVIMGTGVGGGVVLRDRNGEVRAWDGAHGIAGEWGHIVVEPTSGPPCYCGKRGCVEQYLSGPAIERAHRARGGAPSSVAEIVAQRSTDEIARATCDEMIEIFGRAMATVIDVLDPNTIVLGGGVSNVAFFYDEGLRSVGRWIFNDEVRTRIVKNSLGDSAGVLGAAILP